MSAVQLSSPEPEASSPDLPPRQGRPLIAFASAVVRRLGQGRPPAPQVAPQALFAEWEPERRRVVCRSPAQGRPPSYFSECRRVAAGGTLAETADDGPVARQAFLASARVVRGAAGPAVRRPRQGRPPSSCCECPGCVGGSRQAFFASARASSFCECQNCVHGVCCPPSSPGCPPSPPGSPSPPPQSPAKVLLRVPGMCWRVAPRFFWECQSRLLPRLPKLILRVPELCLLSAVPARSPSLPGSSAVLAGSPTKLFRLQCVVRPRQW